MRDGRVHEPLGANVAANTVRPVGDQKQKQSQDERAVEIIDSGHAKHGGEHADRNQDRGSGDDQAEGAVARAVNYRKHEDSGAAVIFAVHPGDGHEVRELPEK